MSTLESPPRTETDEVLNQSIPLQGHNLFDCDRVLVEALDREGGDWAVDRVRELGELLGRPDIQRLGVLANTNTPIFRSHDRFGNRIDEIEYDASWHQLLEIGVGAGISSLPWTDPQPGAHVARGALAMLMTQVEGGVMCPISMTYAAIPALRHQPELAEEWEPRFLSNTYDFGLRPAADKAGSLCGMAMTEKQGGSDVRANTTTAKPLNGGGPGAEYEIHGHKWFCSAPMCDAFLVLAQTDGGVSCLLMPRVLPDGERNDFRIQRLKDKLGDRSNASSEVEFHGAWARLVGEEGAGVRTIIEMVNHTRLDCALGSAAGMRAGAAAATWHAAHRSAFGKLLAEQPLMQNVLADLCIESEAATVSAIWLARAFDEAAGGDQRAALVARSATPVLKYWICKRGPAHAVESLECHGGNGFVEDSGMPRLYRGAPLASIWEGSGNVQALDLLRAMVKKPESLETFFAEVEQASAAEPRLAAYAKKVRDEFTDLETIEPRARRVAERMALALQASLLVRFGDPRVADAFCASRLDGDWGHAFGTLPAGLDFAAIVERHTPAV